MRYAAVAATLLLLALLPAAQAAPAQFTVRQLQAVGPDPGALQGDLMILTIDDTSNQIPPPPLPPFNVHAKALHFTIDRADVGVRAGPMRYDFMPYVVHEEYGASMLQQVSQRTGYKVDVLAAPGHPPPTATVSRDCFRLNTTDVNHVARTATVNNSRPPDRVTLTQAVSVTACGETVVTITGTFRLHLWETDVTLTTSERTTLMKSGQESVPDNDAVTPVAQNQTVKAGRDQEFYITVEEGTFESTFTALTDLYMGSLHGTLDGELVLTDAHGQLGTGLATQTVVEDETVRLRGGPLVLTLEGHGQDPMQVTLDGTWREAELGDLVIDSDPPGRASSAAPVLLAVLALLGLALRRRGPPS